jgi:iron-sulfur cluster repair protein YtfE (RIC family)
MTAAPTTTAPLAVETAALESVTVDLYRDIHKGIRAELFAVTTLTGSADAADDEALRTLVARQHALAVLLEHHAAHEDEHVQPLLERHAGDLADIVTRDHDALERHMARVVSLAERAVDAPAGARRLAVHRWYLAMASFSSQYLAHQAFEELELAPTLAAAIGTDGLAAAHDAIVSNIPPDEMASALAVMFPAMNLDDRAEMLGGMRDGAPPEVFAGVSALASSVLTASDYEALTRRLG